MPNMRSYTDLQCNVADDFEVNVPVDGTITFKVIFDENQEPLEFPEGTKVLKGYLEIRVWVKPMGGTNANYINNNA